MDRTKLSRWHEKILSILKELGLEITGVRTSKHIVVKGILNNKNFRWVTSSTPSTTDAYKKMIADLKRELRQCGVSKIPEFSLKFLTVLNDDEDIWTIIEHIECELNNNKD